MPLKIVDLVSNDQIVAIAAENSPINFCSIVWFLYVIYVKYFDHSSNNIDNLWSQCAQIATISFVQLSIKTKG